MQRIYNYFLARYANQEFIDFSRARLILQFCLITAIFSAFYTIIANYIGFQTSAKVMPAMAILFLGLALSLRTRLKLDQISFLYLFLSFIASVVLIYYSGLIYSSITPWLAFIPMAANLLIGKKSAVLWLIISVLTVFVFTWLSPTRESVEIQYLMKHDKFFFAVVYNGLIGIILVLSMVYQKSRDQYLTLLEEKNNLISKINKELQEKNDEIVAQNEELVQQKEEILTQREFIEIRKNELLTIQNELNDIIDKLTATQSELADREAENRSILNAIYNTEMLVGELDLDGRFIKFSPLFVKFLKLDKNEMIGKTFEELSGNSKIIQEQVADYKTYWKTVIDGKHLTIDFTIKLDHINYVLKINFFPIKDDKGDVLKIMIVGQDISQIHRQKEEIETLNRDLTEKIIKIEQQNILLITQRQEIEKINEEIRNNNEEIKNINASLEVRVRERTKNLEEKNKQLAEYAYINSHMLRGPLCSILGLVNLLETNSNADHEMIVLHMKKSSDELQNVVNKITKAIADGSHFDRKILSPN